MKTDRVCSYVFFFWLLFMAAIFSFTGVRWLWKGFLDFTLVKQCLLISGPFAVVAFVVGISSVEGGEKQ
jgi:hypothetical protein